VGHVGLHHLVLPHRASPSPSSFLSAGEELVADPSFCLLSQAFFPILYGFYRFIWRRQERGPSAHEMDFVSGSRDEQAFSEGEPEPTAEPKSMGRKVLAYVL